MKGPLNQLSPAFLLPSLDVWYCDIETKHGRTMAIGSQEKLAASDKAVIMTVARPTMMSLP